MNFLKIRWIGMFLLRIGLTGEPFKCDIDPPDSISHGVSQSNISHKIIICFSFSFYWCNYYDHFQLNSLLCHSHNYIFYNISQFVCRRLISWIITYGINYFSSSNTLWNIWQILHIRLRNITLRCLINRYAAC
jgi:hypothetical protein